MGVQTFFSSLRIERMLSRYRPVAVGPRPQAAKDAFFFLNDPATPEIYPFPLHAALPIWMTGSNRRPPACKAGAPPAELTPRDPRQPDIGILVGLVGPKPTPPALSRRCSNQLSYRPSQIGRAHV